MMTERSPALTTETQALPTYGIGVQCAMKILMLICLAILVTSCNDKQVVKGPFTPNSPYCKGYHMRPIYSKGDNSLLVKRGFEVEHLIFPQAIGNSLHIEKQEHSDNKPLGNIKMLYDHELKGWTFSRGDEDSLGDDCLDFLFKP